MSLIELLGDGHASKETRKAYLKNPDPRSVQDLIMTRKSASGPGRVGAVSTGSAHATKVGMEILRIGGNAADAAAAAAFAIMVVDPPNASPAGRGHVIWDKPGQEPRAIDGATSAPSELPQGLSKLPDTQALPLPGVVRAVLKLHQEAGQLPLGDVVRPARDLARDGFLISPELARIWKWRAPEIKDADARRVYVPGGQPLEENDQFKQPGIAAFFDHLLYLGHDPFSDPDFARGFVERINSKGACWSLDDLIAAEPLEGETVSVSMDDWSLSSIGRQGWGHTLLRIVTLVASVEAHSEMTSEIAHLLAILRAFEERPEELRSLKPKDDAESWEILFERLGEPLPDNWAQSAAMSQAVDRATQFSSAEDRDTTHLSVVDSAGMRVALTQSIGPHFGARVTDPETGILLAHSYRMAQHPTAGARDVTEQCPCLFDLRGIRYALGAAGSERIPGAVAAVIRHLTNGQDLKSAMAAPRSNWIGSTARLHIDAPTGLDDHLSGAGIDIEFTGRGPVDHLGIVQAVGRWPDGQTVAAADPAYAGSAQAE